MIRKRSLAPAALGFGLALAGLGLAHAQPNTVPPSQDLTGVWWAKAIPAEIGPMDGSPLPYTPAGKAKADEMAAALKSGKLVDRARHICLPQGVPRAFDTPYPIQIVSTPEQTTVFFEENRQIHQLRYIPEHHKDDFWDPSFMGDTIAHWEGDTLVADTRNFNDEVMAGGPGVPHSAKLKVIQKFRKLAGGKQLEVVTTVDDPEIFTKPWSTRFIYDRHDEVEVDTSWICGEPHRDVSKVQRLARGKSK